MHEANLIFSKPTVDRSEHQQTMNAVRFWVQQWDAAASTSDELALTYTAIRDYTRVHTAYCTAFYRIILIAIPGPLLLFGS